MGIAPTSLPATNVATAPVQPGPVELSPGDRIGRYVIGQPLGGGGMGMVFLASDPELNRRVAIKVVRPAYGRSGLEAQARLLREAQVMAALSHPNVITVHDVGTFGDDVFVAMEYIEGGTLRDFVEAPGRTRDEITAAFVGAGRGLAAAHEAQLIHRDFKPDNVMIADDGRVLVLDFGLARPEFGSSLASSPVSSDSRSEDAEFVSLTQTGAAMGTPAYMAPEQHAGAAVPASDQYSFCVTLFEALCGHRPFAGHDMRALQKQKLRETRIVLPAEARVPRWQQAVILRGLRSDPEQRFTSMRALVDALERSPRKNRRAAAVLSVVTLIVVGAAGVAGAPGDPCDSTRGSVVGELWGPSERDAVDASILGSQTPYAQTASATVVRMLDEHAEALVAGERAACRATHVAKMQSDTVLDLRNACLDRRRQELAAVVDVLTEPPPATAQGDETQVAQWAVDAAGALVSPAACDDIARLEQQVPLPTGPAARSRLRHLRRELGRASALWAAGRYDEARSSIDLLLIDAEALDYTPLVADVYYVRGLNLQSLAKHEDAAAAYLSAIDLADEARHDRLAARAWTSLAFTTGHSLARYDEAESMLRAAEAAVKRAGDDAELRASLLRAQGQNAFDRGDFPGSRQLLEGSLEALETASQSDSRSDHVELGRATTLAALARTLAAQGEVSEAESGYRRLIDTLEGIHGGEHPKVAQAFGYLGMVQFEQGRTDDALASYERALAIQDASLPADHPQVAFTLNNVAGIYGMLGRHAEAREFYERARISLERRLGQSHPDVGRLTFNVAELWKLMGDLEKSRAEYERALTIFVETLGAQHPDVGRARNNLAAIFYDLGELEAAQRDYAEAVRILEPAFGSEHPNLAYPLTGLGQSLLDLGRLEESRTALERALAVRVGGDGVDPVDLADTRYALARTLWAQDAERGRALALAESAASAYEKAGTPRAKQREELLRWLASR